jgi:aryl-alcohol dehydrogenase-like predicted oxidoreductase
MERRRLGKTDMDASVLGFGAGEIGFEGVDVATVKKLLGSALDTGLNVIDTAECYANSEELLGEAVSDRRKEFFLFTKCGHAAGYASPDWSTAALFASIERSVQRLKTDRVDLVQLHSCSLDILKKGDAIAALEKARMRGLTRYVGYSGDGAAAKWALESGKFDVLQTSVNIADQEALDLVLPLAREKNVGVIAKRPIANAAWKTGQRPASEYHHVYWERLEKLRYEFLEPGSPESISVALCFTLSVPGVHTAIVGTTKPGRWQENAAFIEKGPLPKDLFERIRHRWKEVAKPSWAGQT